MGSPSEWYKLSLQYFAHGLSGKISNFQTLSEEELEAYITEKGSQVNEKIFYYKAGNAATKMCLDAYETGSDALTAAAGGLLQFEDFIGLEDE